MAEKNFVSVLTAQNATETVKTLIDTIDVPQGVSKLVEIGAQLNMAGYTTIEGIGFILEIECDNAAQWGGTQQFASDTIIPLVPVNAVVVPSRIHDCDIAVVAGMKLKMSTTFNAALTINPTIRVFGKFV